MNLIIDINAVLMSYKKWVCGLECSFLSEHILCVILHESVQLTGPCGVVIF